MPLSLPPLTNSAILRARLSGLTMYGNWVTTSRARPVLSSSMSITARMITDPRPVRYASSIPRRPTIRAPLGKSGPWIRSIAASSSSSAVASGCSSAHCTAAATSRRLWVGMLVAMPTAMPVDPLTSRFGNRARQDDRLLLLAVVIGLEVDRVLTDVADHLHGQRRHFALGVAHRRGFVIAGRAEVTLTGDQRIAHHPGLSQAYQGVVDRPVAVRVVLPHHLADDAGALVPAPVRPVAAVVHAVEDPSVHRLQPVADVRQRPSDDHTHRVVEVGLLDLVLQVDRLHPVGDRGLRRIGHV